MTETKIRLGKALRAGYTFFYAPTFEMDRTVDKILEEIKAVERGDWKPAVWDFETGDQNPDLVLEMLEGAEPYTALIAKNWNWFLASDVGEKNYNAIQFIQNRFEEFSARETRKALIIVSDVEFNTAIPAALQKEFVVLDFPLPGRDEVKEILDGIIDAASASDTFKKPKKAEVSDLVEAAIGLTRRGCQNAFAYSVIETGERLDPKIVAAMRSAEINETAGLMVANYDVDEIQGLDIAKEHLLDTAADPDARGVLLLGPPGTVKTMLAKWLSTQMSKLMIEFDLAKVQGSGLYGQAEQEMANAIKVIKSIMNCILFIDEIEKAIPGKGATNDTTGTRSFGQLLKFLSDERPVGCFVIATCNDISKLPPEWVRSERFDVIFFIDMPNDEEKTAIYLHYLDTFKVESGGFTVQQMKDWTGAEIKTACRLAKIKKKTVKEAAKMVVPVAETMKDDIEYLRGWAKGRTVPASSAQTTTDKRVRQVDI